MLGPTVVSDPESPGKKEPDAIPRPDYRRPSEGIAKLQPILWIVGP